MADSTVALSAQEGGDRSRSTATSCGPTPCSTTGWTQRRGTRRSGNLPITGSTALGHRSCGISASSGCGGSPTTLPNAQGAGYGIGIVEGVPVVCEHTSHNIRYPRTKQERWGPARPHPRRRRRSDMSECGLLVDEGLFREATSQFPSGSR